MRESLKEAGRAAQKICELQLEQWTFSRVINDLRISALMEQLGAAVSKTAKPSSEPNTVMKICNRISAWLTGPRILAFPEPMCVQDGTLRAYIWPSKEHFGYEVVDAGGEKLCVGAEPSFDTARNHALEMLRRMR